MKHVKAALAILSGVATMPAAAQVMLGPVSKAEQKTYADCLQSFGARIPADEKQHFDRLAGYFAPSDRPMSAAFNDGSVLFTREKALYSFGWAFDREMGLIYDVERGEVADMPGRTSVIFGFCLNPGTPA